MQTSSSSAAAPTAPDALATDARLSEFAARVDQRFRRQEIRSFWELEDEFRQLVRSRALHDHINSELGLMVTQHSRMGDWKPNQLLVTRGPAFALSIFLVEQPRKFIHSASFLGMYAPLGKESLIYDVYRLPGHYRNEVFDPSVTLEFVRSGSTAPGEILRAESDLFVYDFKIEKPVALAKFATSSFLSLEWLFHKDTLKAHQANDSELTWTQLRVAANILGRLGHASSRAPLEKLTTHSHHAVRWAAIQNLARISAEAVVPKLELAVNDPHPHVRRAAAKTLQHLNAQKQAEG